jgi:hypothetical protein
MRKHTLAYLVTCLRLGQLLYRLLIIRIVVLNRAFSWLACAKPTLDDDGDEIMIGGFLFMKPQSAISNTASRLQLHAL